MTGRKISLWQRFLYLLEAFFVIPLGGLIRILPRFIVKAFVRFFGWLLFHIDKRDKKWAYENLDIVFPEKHMTLEEKDKLLRQVFHYIARGGVEYMQMGRIRTNNYQKYAVFENYENLGKAVALGKGVIVATAHMGNWEMLASIPAKLGLKLAVVINRQFNPYTDAWLKRIREKRGKVRCFYNNISDLTNIMRHLKKGGVVGMVADQTYYFKPIFVPFFGRTSATADGPAKMHRKFGSPIVVAMSILQPDGRYKLIFEEPKVFEKTDNAKADHKRIMTWINSRYEYYIRKYPEQWFSLLHPRWEKTKPEDFDDIEIDPW